MGTSPERDPAVDGYISRFPEDVQDRLNQLRGLVWEVAPDAVESISYAIPTYKLKGKPLIYFAGYARHIGVYPLPENPSDELATQIEPFVTGKGTLQFRHGDPLPLDLIRRVVECRRDHITLT